jgi:hypothetical protein
MNNLLKQWLERFEQEEDVDLFDLISTNCDYLDKWDLVKLVRELIWFFDKDRTNKKEKGKSFIEQLKEYREEWFD